MLVYLQVTPILKHANLHAFCPCMYAAQSFHRQVLPVCHKNLSSSEGTCRSSRSSCTIPGRALLVHMRDLPKARPLLGRCCRPAWPRLSSSRRMRGGRGQGCHELGAAQGVEVLRPGVAGDVEAHAAQEHLHDAATQVVCMLEPTVDSSLLLEVSLTIDPHMCTSTC